VKVVASINHTCALDSSGNIDCWGQDPQSNGILEVPQ